MLILVCTPTSLGLNLTISNLHSLTWEVPGVMVHLSSVSRVVENVMYQYILVLTFSVDIKIVSFSIEYISLPNFSKHLFISSQH